MCEHAGMLNHFYAKIADTGLAQGQVLAQTAPQCFDISLWQLLAAPLVGGTTLLVDQEAILEVARFLDTIVGARVAVVQLVPSYLEALLALLERHPRTLPDLRCVSTTGETLNKELTVRWFAAQPDIMLINAYGLTETSDDTNHEILRRPPDSERVPLGPPIPNVRLYLVDEHLQPVPLGAPGEIVYSGVCVGRGYVNDPERTAAVYLPDPHRPGERLYRGGDIGRWRPDGKLEFLGRRDSQVKIRGFRIEIGEVENVLLGADGVREGAVVVGGTGYDTHLVAFYTSAGPIGEDHLNAHLRRSLPRYMVPGAFHRRGQLPQTANGKIDHKALTALAAELDARDRGPDSAVGGRADLSPRSSAEQRVAAAWAAVLGVPQAQLGRHDHFFDCGGTSLSAVKLAIILNRAVSHRDITEHPTLAELADLIDQRTPGPALEQSPAS
jgi:acyl-coenzyme A synthetase/AMP-(fatty) acid ligase